MKICIIFYHHSSIFHLSSFQSCRTLFRLHWVVVHWLNHIHSFECFISMWQSIFSFHSPFWFVFSNFLMFQMDATLCIMYKDIIWNGWWYEIPVRLKNWKLGNCLSFHSLSVSQMTSVMLFYNWSGNSYLDRSHSFIVFAHIHSVYMNILYICIHFYEEFTNRV